MPLVFDWDEGNRKHIAEHGITPKEAEQVVISDPLDLTLQEIGEEERTLQVGQTDRGRILVVVTTWRDSKVRVVTAFPAPKQLREFYLMHSS
jgi:uncharacterized protein